MFISQTSKSLLFRVIRYSDPFCFSTKKFKLDYTKIGILAWLNFSVQFETDSFLHASSLEKSRNFWISNSTSEAHRGMSYNGQPSASVVQYMKSSSSTSRLIKICLTCGIGCENAAFSAA